MPVVIAMRHGHAFQSSLWGSFCCVLLLATIGNGCSASSETPLHLDSVADSGDDVAEPIEDSIKGDAADQRTETVANECPPPSLPLSDPNHRYRFISVTALDDDVLVDAIGVHFPVVDSCTVYSDTVENADLDNDDPRLGELLWEPDATIDGMCDEDLAHPLFEAGDAVWVIIPANILEGAIVEVREVRACQNPGSAPVFEVSVHQDLDDPGRVIGTGSGPIATFELAQGFYD